MNVAYTVCLLEGNDYIQIKSHFDQIL